ncbi:MAG TPA: DUF3592 domain-containing protein [Tabrizicola sp.]|nr:DUF3592 domain-containing protein [Tabrizicola sp.]
MTGTGNPRALGAIVGLLALFFWVQWYMASSRATLLSADPVVAEAVVMQLDRQEGVGRGRIFTSDSVILRFDVAPGTRLSSRTPVSDERFDTLALGQTVTVRYARQDPSIVEIEPGTLADKATLHLVFALALTVLLGLGLALVASYRAVLAAGGAESR